MKRKRSRGRRKTVWPWILLLVVIVAGAAVWFFGRKENVEEQEKKTVWQEGSMLRIGDHQVDYREGMVYLDAVKEDYEKYYGSDIWKYAVDSHGNTMGEVIKKQTLEQIIYVKVVCQKADEMGIVLSEDELRLVDEQTAAYMEKIKDSELLLHGVNADIVRRIYSDNMLAKKTYEVITLNVDTKVSNEEATQRRYYSIAIRNFKIDALGTRVSYEGTELEELKARMEALRQQALETEDFYKLAEANTEDSGMLQITGGRGDFPEAYEEQILSLKAGQVSEWMETTDFYYMYYCVTEYDVDATYAKKEAIIAGRQEKEFQTRYQQWRGITHVEVNEPVWDALDFEVNSVG